MPALTLQVPPGLATEGTAVPPVDPPAAPASLAAGKVAMESVPPGPIRPGHLAAEPPAPVPMVPRSVPAATMASRPLPTDMPTGLPADPAEPTKANRLVGNIPWLNPQGPWGETQAFLAFVTIVGVIFLISPRRGWAARDEEEE